MTDTTARTPDTPSPDSIFVRAATCASIDQLHRGTAVERLGIEFLQVGPDVLRARMPVDERTRQPVGILHGGASVLLAETLGSAAANLCLPPHQHAVGLDINANHIRAIRSGWVIGECRPIHRGRTTSVWQIEIRDEQQRLVCTSRITMAVLDSAPN
jgi:1,4-dihydroxy-2-naphthoyl-CoA hydrolase